MEVYDAPDLDEWSAQYIMEENRRRGLTKDVLQARLEWRRSHTAARGADSVEARLAALEAFIDANFSAPLNVPALERMQDPPATTHDEAREEYFKRYGVRYQSLGGYQSLSGSSAGNVFQASSNKSMVDKVFNDFCKQKISLR